MSDTPYHRKETLSRQTDGHNKDNTSFFSPCGKVVGTKLSKYYHYKLTMSIANKFKPISISLSPNVEKDDVRLALRLLFQPWKWAGRKTAPALGGDSIVPASAINKLEEKFKKYLGVKYAISFNSGRSSLFAILLALSLPKGSNVLLQAFTCNAVPNPILWANLNPIYVDCGNDFNIDIEDLKNKIHYSLIRTNRRIVLVVQHTFGLPANMDEILKIAKENNLTIIEDCAHALGATYEQQETRDKGQGTKRVGTFGDAAFFSFSRDKVISCVYGGMAVTNNDEIGKKLQELQKEFGQPSLFWTRQQIFHPILLHYIILPIYNFIDLGKIFLVFSQWAQILSKAVSWKEKRGLMPDYFPKALPNALAEMALNQFNKLEKFNQHRKEIAEFYYQELENTQFILPARNASHSDAGGPERNGNIFLRFAVRHPKAHEIIYEAWHKENILLGDWYTTPIAPDDTKIEEMKYITGMCPNAEKLAKQTLNLPTHINIDMEDVKRIVNFLKKWS